jgi:hypothetical protein
MSFAHSELRTLIMRPICFERSDGYNISLSLRKSNSTFTRCRRRISGCASIRKPVSDSSAVRRHRHWVFRYCDVLFSSTDLAPDCSSLSSVREVF